MVHKKLGKIDFCGMCGSLIFPIVEKVRLCGALIVSSVVVRHTHATTPINLFFYCYIKSSESVSFQNDDSEP